MLIKNKVEEKNKNFSKPRKTLPQRVVQGGAWISSLKVIGKIFSLIRLIIIGRILAPSDFGLMGIALLTMSALETFSTTGFDQALIQKKESTEKYLDAAEEAAHFILQEMRKEGDLMRVYNRGRCLVKGYSEDYAFFIQALLDLYEATFEIDWLKEADDLNGRMIHQFWDQRKGGFFFSGKENESLIARSKSPYDNAIPSSNSVGVINLLRLGYLTGEDSLKEKAEQILRLFYPFLKEHPSGFSHMLSGFSFFISPEEIGIVGPKNDPRTQSMLREVNLAFLPHKILSLKDPKEQIKGSWLPFLKDREVAEAPTAFVCKGFTCLPPARDEKELRKILS